VLAVFLTCEFIGDLPSILVVDYLLVIKPAKGQVVDLVGEVNFQATLEQLHHGLGAVVR